MSTINMKHLKMKRKFFKLCPFLLAVMFIGVLLLCFKMWGSSWVMTFK